MSKYSTNEMTSVDQKRVTVVGVDLGKTWIGVCGQDASGKVDLTGKRRPAQFKALMAQLLACLVGLEACGRSHHWARVLQGYSHEVKLKAPQFVKPLQCRSCQHEHGACNMGANQICPQNSVSELRLFATLIFRNT